MYTPYKELDLSIRSAKACHPLQERTGSHHMIKVIDDHLCRLDLGVNSTSTDLSVATETGKMKGLLDAMHEKGWFPAPEIRTHRQIQEEYASLQRSVQESFKREDRHALGALSLLSATHSTFPTQEQRKRALSILDSSRSLADPALRLRHTEFRNFPENDDDDDFYDEDLEVDDEYDSSDDEDAISFVQPVYAVAPATPSPVATVPLTLVATVPPTPVATLPVTPATTVPPTPLYSTAPPTPVSYIPTASVPASTGYFPASAAIATAPVATPAITPLTTVPSTLASPPPSPSAGTAKTTRATTQRLR